jgi:hypothetical protein
MHFSKLKNRGQTIKHLRELYEIENLAQEVISTIKSHKQGRLTRHVSQQEKCGSSKQLISKQG